MTLFIIMIAYLIGIIWGLYIKSIASIFFISIILFILLLSKYSKLKKNKKEGKTKQESRVKTDNKSKQKLSIKTDNITKQELRLKTDNKIKLKILKNIKYIVMFFIVFTISILNIKTFDNLFENKYKNINNSLSIKAIVVSNTIEKEYKNVYKIKIESINNKQKYKGDLLQLQIKNKKIELDYGDEIEFVGEFQLPQTSRNTGEFNYREYLKTKKIYGTVSTKSIKILNKEQGNKFFILVNKLKLNMENKIDKLLDEDEANLLKGFLLGDKDNLNPEIQENFRDSSLSHLLAVSGAHVAYVILGISLILNMIKIHKKHNKIITIFLLILFMILTGATPSVVRACIMSIYIIFGSLIYRKPSTLNSISLALLIIMIFNPYQILDVGFQLSFGGTIGIILFNKRITDAIEIKIYKKLENSSNQLSKLQSKQQTNEKRNSKKLKSSCKLVNNMKNSVKKLIKKVLKYIKTIIIVSLSANIIIIPIMLYHYNTLSFTFIISNLLSAPLLGIIIIFGFILIIVSFVSFKIAKFISIILSIILKLLIQITNIFSKLPLSKIYLPTPPIALLIVYYLILYIIISKKIYKIQEKLRRKQLKTILTNKKILAFIIAFIVMFTTIKIAPNDLRINFIDVGQGDCALITTPRNKKILIDGGGSESNSNYDIGKNVVLPYLLDKGITKLDYIIISHFDTDHVGRNTYNYE